MLHRFSWGILALAMNNESEIDRNDRSAGRQLAVALIVGGGLLAVLGGLLAWSGAGVTPVFVCGAPLLLGLVAAAFPIHAIRIAMGRLSELGQHGAREGSSGERARGAGDRGGEGSLLEKMQEGAPAETVVIEALVRSKRTRARVGIGGMIVGTGGCVLSFVAAEVWARPELVDRAGMPIFALAVVGLIVWYRTL